MKSEIGVGIIGFGTVGTGVARILLDNASLIRRRLGVPRERSPHATSRWRT